MSELNIETSTTESVVVLSEALSTSTLPSTSSSTTIDDEARRRKILSKLWGKGNKLSHKVRELDKSTINNSSDSSIHIDNEQKQIGENSNNLLASSSMNDPKSSTEDSSNSINSSKPLAVVKPIVVVKSGLIISSSTDRTRINSEASSTTITQIHETTITVNERQSSTTTTIDRTSDKKKRIRKNKNSKKKKTTRDQSTDRERSAEQNRSHHHHHHQHQTDSNKKNSSSSKTNRQEHDEDISINNNNHKSSRPHSSSTISSNKNNRQSPSDDSHHTNRQSNRSTTSKKDESSSVHKSILSPVDHHHNRSNSKYESNTNHNYSSHRHRRRSSITLSPSPPSRSSYSTSNKDRLQTKNSSSPKKDDRHSTTQIKSNRQQNKSINSHSPSDSSSKLRRHGSDIVADDDTHRYKTRTSDEHLTNSSKSQKSLEISPEDHHHHHRSSSTSIVKQEKSKTIQNNDKNEINQEKSYSSRHDRRSSSRHRSKSKENKINRKPIEPLSSDDSSNNQNKINNEKSSTTVNENSHNDKKSNHRSSIPSSNNDHRRKSSSDYHRYDRHDSPSNYDRRNDYHHHHHRIPSSHSYYPSTHYVHHHHHHHYRSTSSRYYDRRRSISPRSHHHQRRSRYFSSTSSSLSPSPRRRSSSRTSSSSSHSPSSYSSISRTSSSRSSSRNNNNNHHYYHHHHEKKFHRSPTLEKIFLKASESIESISTQKNPNILSSSSSTSTTTHLIPISTTNISSDMQISSTINSHSETNTFYSENFTGFSIPPPPFISQPQQRCLKEITTEPVISRRSVLNEVQSSTSTIHDEIIPIKTVQSNDISIRSGSSKPPRISRFSDITSSIISEPALNTNLSVDTPLNYTQINENINCLSSSRRQQKRHNREVMECECTTSEYDRSRGIKACGHECLNRMLLIECGPMCPCEQWCTNRRFQRRSYANHKLALFKTEMKGYGLRTIASIHKGRFLVEYIGEVIDMDELSRRNKKYKRDGNIHQYVMSLIHGTVIDSTIKGNWARFINHSCEPNCVAEKWLVNGEYRMGIFAKRDLNINEEITIDYRFETFGTSDLINEKCYCGASTCRGTISVKKNNNNNALNQRQNRQQPLDDDEILNYLLDDNTNEYIIPKTIDDIRQLIQIMSRTDSENVRTIELNLIKNSSQKQFELPRLFLECNGLHVLCSWMKDILIDDDEQQYTNEFKYHLLDFIHTVLPIKDRTIVIKNGLLDLVYKKLKLPISTIDNLGNNDQEQINNLMNSILNHLDDPIISKVFHLYSTWMSLKERYIIPKRKEPEQPVNHHHRHHHHHHHHHSSKYSYEETNSRFNFSTRSSVTQQKPNDRPFTKRSYVVRETPRTTQEQQLSKDERRKLFEQQYEDAEKAKAAAAAAAANNESPGVQNEPPQKKQRTSDSTEPMVPSTPPQLQSSTMPNTIPWIFPSNAIYPQPIDQTYWIHQHLSQIPIDYIRSYMASIGQPISVSNTSIDKDEPPLPPPPKPDNENELSRIIYLPSGWSVAMYPSDSSVYFYNRKTMATSWIPPSLTVSTEHSLSLPPPPPLPLDLSPLSSAQIHDQRRPQHDQQQVSSSSRSSMKLLKHSHRHNRNHRYYHHHQHMSSNNKRKRPSTIESTTAVKEELNSQLKEETSIIVSNEQFKQDEINDKKSIIEHTEEMSVDVSKISIDGNNENNVSITVKESSEINDNIDKQISSNSNTLSSSSKINRDLLRKNISQHVHTTLKPYTKRTCKQGRIVSTDDIKYLVKKFTLAVLDKEIEKAKNDGIPLLPTLTERVRLKTEVYVKKYMNKMGPVFQRHDTTVHPSSQPPQQSTTTTTITTSNPE
ncbi:unnamed protein product [Rotaria sp. Silwood1]|nr:unnamed protein product [Rotaria sp. Silwood1]CAF1506810.1 unnamed protein product [Rotaria sp. Silwood1]